jgi:hypothetical protein
VSAINDVAEPTRRRYSIAGKIRGRPQCAATEPADGRSARLRSRVGWLLRVNRLYGGDAAWVSGAAFSAAFAGGCHPAAVSQSKISRWETGITGVPYSAVRRYEQVLGLPACSLSSVIDVIGRYMSSPAAGDSPGRWWPPGERAVTGPILEELLDQASSHAKMTAAGWDSLTAQLAAAPGLRLRRREWDTICHRLLTETIAADGEAWKPRFEAFNRLLEHPDGQQAAVTACADWAGDRGNHVFTETVGLLDACRHPAAATAVLGQLTDPTNDDAFAGALLACVRKVTEHHFTAAQLRTVAGAACDLLASSAPAHDQLRAHAAAALTRMPADLRQHTGPQARLLALSLTEGTARPYVHAAGIDDSLPGLLAARSTSLLPREIAHFDDRVLPSLTGEMLRAPVSDTRLYAAFLIRATPYRAPVANALAWRLSRLRSAEDPFLAGRLLEALRILGGTAERGIAESLTDSRFPFPVQDAAFQALGHMDGTSQAVFWQEALTSHSSQEQPRNNSGKRLLDHAVYALAMKRNIAELHRIAADQRLPPSVQQAARWWLSVPGHMLSSAES